MKCYKCKHDLPVEAFQKDAGRSRGYTGYCKTCLNAKRRSKYATNDTFREEVLVRVKKRAETLDLSPYLKQWQKANPDKCAEYTAKRRALLADAFVEEIDRRAVWGRDEGHCRRCSVFVPFEEMHLDHITPISKGGAHAYYNVQTLCAPCNRSKSAKIEEVRI